MLTRELERPIPGSPAPVPVGQRIDSIDVLRGVAVLGILALNIQSFAMPGAAYMNPMAYGDLAGVNYWIWYFTHLLGDQKFWSIFSMLFGAGIVMSTSRCEATGRSAAGIHYRRMLWLMVFGLLHAHLIWYGDILYTYAVCGMVLFPFRKLSPRWLIGLGIIPLLVAFGISLGLGALLVSGTVPEMNAEMALEWQPDDATLQAELETYRGSWLQQMPKRSASALFFETMLFLINFGWRSAALILIGMALYKLDVFSAARSNSSYCGLLATAVLAGLPLVAWGVYQNQQHEWALEYSFMFGPLYNYWGSVLVALGWVAVVMLVCRSPGLRPFTRPLAATGRMSLTCYVLQSIICTLIFYGHGLGLFGTFERWQQLLTVVAVWIVLLIFAPLWLSYFRFGPFEWLWRYLTYLNVQPIRRAVSQSSTGS